MGYRHSGADRVTLELEEILDRDDLSLDDTRRALDDLARVNLLLFGRSALQRALLPRLGAAGAPRQTLLDIAAGAGDSTAALQRRASARGVELLVVSTDRKLSHLLLGRRGGTISSAVVAQAERSPFRAASFDWVVSSLFFHHLDDDTKLEVLVDMGRVARRSAVVVDLRRSLWAGWSLSVLGRLIGMGRIALGDGLISLRRTLSFEEWGIFASRAGAELEARFPARVTIVVGSASGPEKPYEVGARGESRGRPAAD